MSHPDRVVSILADALVACNRISRYISGLDQAAFTADHLVQDGVIRQVSVIGEVANAIRKEDDAFFERHGLDEMLLAIAMRNRIIHDYRGVSVKLLWGTASQSVPALRLRVIAVLRAFDAVCDVDSVEF